jgi:hypothetical protein
MDWTDEYNQIVCELMAQQVRKGTEYTFEHSSYTEVSKMFFQITGIELTKTQLKNKWDRLKGDWQIWQKLVQRQTGIG